MSRHAIRTIALDEEACGRLHEATVELLEGTGVDVQHDGALALLSKAGARVDGTRVRIPAELVTQALATAPREVTVTSRNGGGGGIDLKVGASYYGTGSDCLYVVGPGARERRPASLADVEEIAVLQEKLTNIDYVMSMAQPHELDSSFAPAAQFAAMLRGTSKPLLMVPENAAHLDLFMEMSEVCGGRDSWGIYAMPTPPLQHGFESTERLVRCAELGIPMIYGGAYLPGATIPASLAAYVVVANVEVLSGLVITQLAKSGAPFVYCVAQGWMNPRTAHALYSSAEQMAGQQASADLAHFYGLPTFGYGGVSDSVILDEQWAFEAGMTLLGGAMSGVTLVHDLGYLASGTAFSFEAVTVLDELVGYVKAYLDGVTIDDEQLALEEIASVGPGGTHLSQKYTRRHVRDFHSPSLIAHDSYDAWVEAGGSSLLTRAAEATRALRESERAYALEPEALRELDKLVEGARGARAL